MVTICMEYHFPFFHFELFVSLDLKWVSSRQNIVESCFLKKSILLISVFWLENLTHSHLKHLLIRKRFLSFWYLFSVCIIAYLPLIFCITVFFCVYLLFILKCSILFSFPFVFSSMIPFEKVLLLVSKMGKIWKK